MPQIMGICCCGFVLRVSLNSFAPSSFLRPRSASLLVLSFGLASMNLTMALRAVSIAAVANPSSFYSWSGET